MKLIPAVDIMGGKCVRLLRGDPKKNKVYYYDPLEAAQLLENQGVELIHVIDLDAALGFGQNIDVIRRMLDNLTVKVQIGGGIRSLQKVDQLLKLGSYRVIFGTAAIKNPDLIKEAVKRYGSESIAVAIDEKNGKVTFHGWKDDSKVNYIDLAKSFEALDIGCLIFTPINVDGTLKGPQIEKTMELVESVDIPVIASGGVAKLEDLIELFKIGVDGVIVGTAIYEKKFTVKDALEVLRNVS
jgi:phosphoribosylformimino-5-aminoimidazole carboxamide ribotide isomerase